MLSTRDGGGSWTPHPQVAPAHLYRVRFITPAIGWIVGDNGTILATQDGGRKWLGQTSGVLRALQDIACFSPQECVVVGDKGTVLRTGNSGKTWTPHKRPAVDDGDDNFTGVAVLSDLTLRATVGGRQGYVLQSDDRGRTWELLKAEREMLPMQLPLSLHFWDSQRGLVVGTELVGGGNGILLTTDGGAKWSAGQVSGWGGHIYVYSLFFVNQQLGWARAQNVTILHTKDGGRTWSIQYSER